MSERMNRRSFLSLAGAAGAVGITGGLAGLAALSGRRFAGAQEAATPAADGFEHPTGAEELVFRVAAVGGFVPVNVSLSELPLISVYGDGLVVTQGPMIEIFPAPALPNLLQSRLTEEGIQAVLAIAADAGLMDGDKTYGNSTVADVPTTVFTTNANGTTTVVAAYALGFGDDPRWTDEERAAIAELVEVSNRVGETLFSADPALVASGEEFYPVERLQILAQPIDPAMATPEPDDPTLNQPPLDWPLATSLLDATPVTDLLGEGFLLTCGVLDGEDAQTVLAAAASANMLTPWVSEGVSYYVTFRPLLPDEDGCPPRPHEGEGLPEASPESM